MADRLIRVVHYPGEAERSPSVPRFGPYIQFGSHGPLLPCAWMPPAGRAAETGAARQPVLLSPREESR